jgi:hypothetical protein
VFAANGKNCVQPIRGEVNARPTKLYLGITFIHLDAAPDPAPARKMMRILAAPAPKHRFYLFAEDVEGWKVEAERLNDNSLVQVPELQHSVLYSHCDILKKFVIS